MSDVTRILSALDQGDPAPRRSCSPSSMTSCASSPPPASPASRLAREAPGQTLDATALVHEAYLRLVGDQKFDGRGHFFAAAEAMRRILIEAARRNRSPRHGGGRRRIDLDAAHRFLEPSDDLLVLDDALGRLAAEDPVAAEVVKLRVFAGLSVEGAADALGLARATAYRHWSFARAWLRCELGDGPPVGESAGA